MGGEGKGEGWSRRGQREEGVCIWIFPCREVTNTCDRKQEGVGARGGLGKGSLRTGETIS